jgi:hypothetical protein
MNDFTDIAFALASYMTEVRELRCQLAETCRQRDESLIFSRRLCDLLADLAIDGYAPDIHHVAQLSTELTDMTVTVTRKFYCPEIHPANDAAEQAESKIK